MAAIGELEPPHPVESSSDDEGECPSKEEEPEREWGASDDSDQDPPFDVAEVMRSAFSRISLKKSNPRTKKSEGDRAVDEIPELDAKDKNCFEAVEKLIKDGVLEKLKVDQCKVYLRKNGLRMTGKKDTLIGRIREHLEIINDGGETRYPISSFVVDCKGDACTGDVVVFEQNVYEMFSIASRSATGPPLGKRLVAGRIVKESYGEAKQQHTFTIEVLWSKGEKPLPPLHQLLIKGRNLYRLKTMRQMWDDEEERRRVLQEKHERGFVARRHRENRIQDKEIRKKGRLNRTKQKTSSKVINGWGSHIQEKPFPPAPLQPQRIQHQMSPQHHPKTQNSVELQFTEQETGTTAGQENHVRQSKLQPGQPPQHSQSLVNSKVLQQVTSINYIIPEIRSKQPPLAENHRKHPQGREQYSSGTDQLLHDHAKHHHPHCESQQRANSYGRQPMQNITASYSSHTNQLRHHARHHQYQSQQGRQFFYKENSSSRADRSQHNHANHLPNRQPCRNYRRGWCHFGKQCKYLHGY